MPRNWDWMDEVHTQKQTIMSCVWHHISIYLVILLRLTHVTLGCIHGLLQSFNLYIHQMSPCMSTCMWY